jgi:hypothetical protein
MEAAPCLLEELSANGLLAHDSLREVTAKGLYESFTETPPPPRVEAKLPHLDWPLIWSRLHSSSLTLQERDFMFRLLHNILPVPERMARINPGASGLCPRCPDSTASVLHTFTECVHTSDIWLSLFFNIHHFFPVIPTNQELLLLSFQRTPRDTDITASIVTFAMLVWVNRSRDDPVTWAELKQELHKRPAPYRPLFHL